MFPGILLSLGIALLARWLESLLPVHVIGSAVIAMFIGMFLNQYLKHRTAFAPGPKFTSKKILKFAIILLGLSLNISTILHVGRMSLMVMVFTLLTCFGGGYFIGKALGLNRKLSNLISAGTGICGGSAIAAISSAIEADDNDVAYAISATFLFDMAMIVLFPIIGNYPSQTFLQKKSVPQNIAARSFGAFFYFYCSRKVMLPVSASMASTMARDSRW